MFEEPNSQQKLNGAFSKLPQSVGKFLIKISILADSHFGKNLEGAVVTSISAKPVAL